MEVKIEKNRKSKSELIPYRSSLYFSVKCYVVFNWFITCLYDNPIKNIKVILFACMCRWVCKLHLATARVRAVEYVSTEISKYITQYIHPCLRARLSLRLTPWLNAKLRSLQSVCVCALPLLLLLLTDRSHWQSRWRQQPCDPRPALRTDTTQASDRRGPCLMWQPGSWCVCQCLWNMPLCSPVNLGLVPLHPHPESPVTVEGIGHVTSLPIFSKMEIVVKRFYRQTER